MATLEASTLFSVKDMVFVITGGGSGLGEHMAKALDVNGASKVFILGRRKASLERVASQAVQRSQSWCIESVSLTPGTEERQHHTDSVRRSIKGRIGRGGA